MSRPRRECPCSPVSQAARLFASSTRIPVTRPSPASPYCASTAASSSPPPKHSTIASARSSETASRDCMRSILDLEGVDFVDSQGAAKLAELHEVVKTDGVTLRLTRVKPQVLAVL